MRSFVAVDAAGSNLIGLQHEMMSSYGWSAREVKPVEHDNIHFTLLFLGEITSQQVDKVKERLAEIKFKQFPVTYTSVGAFPKPSNARVIWVGLDSEGATKLTGLSEQVVAKMSEVGFFPDKPFSPHLTIFRVKNRHVAINTTIYASRIFGKSIVDRVHLKKSDLAPSGPIYSNIYTVSSAEEKKEEA